jgi:hypothetical protein
MITIGQWQLPLESWFVCSTLVGLKEKDTWLSRNLESPILGALSNMTLNGLSIQDKEVPPKWTE